MLKITIGDFLMLNKQLYARLLKFCHHNDKGILVTDEGYTSDHKIKVKDRRLTLKAVHYLMMNGCLPNGTLTSTDGDTSIVDSGFLTYKPYRTKGNTL